MIHVTKPMKPEQWEKLLYNLVYKHEEAETETPFWTNNDDDILYFDNPESEEVTKVIAQYDYQTEQVTWYGPVGYIIEALQA